MLLAALSPGHGAGAASCGPRGPIFRCTPVAQAYGPCPWVDPCESTRSPMGVPLKTRVLLADDHPIVLRGRARDTPA